MTETALEYPGVASEAPPQPSGRRRRPLLPRWLGTVLGNRKAALGVAILTFFILVGLVGQLFLPGNPMVPDYSSAPMLGPSAAHPFGTDQESRDVFRQMVAGTLPTLFIGFALAVLATALGVIGVVGGYVGGWVDELLNMVTNIFLVIPAFPLVIVVASWIQVKNDLPAILIIALTSWPWGARVLRSQTLSLRQRDFVQAAIVSGESSWRIILREILPNMISLVVSGLIGLVVVAVGSVAGLAFLGLGNLNEANWFNILYWAQSASALQQGAWWTFVIPGCAIALIGVACALINYGIDEISNPRLGTVRAERRQPVKTSMPPVAAAGEATAP
jgi:peptide/nickel transport system permease protein